MEQAGHLSISNAEALSLQLLRQLARALTRPAQRRFRVTPCRRPHQRLQCLEKLGIGQGLPPSSASPDSPPFQRFPRTALQLTHPRMDRAPRQARGLRDQRHPAMRQRLRFRRRPEPPLPFVQHPPQRLVFLANPPYAFLLSHAKSLSHLFNMCKLFVRSAYGDQDSG